MRACATARAAAARGGRASAAEPAAASTPRPRARPKKAPPPSPPPPAAPGEGDSLDDAAPLPARSHVRVHDAFLPPQSAAALRATFDARFEEPRRLNAERFCWDYWHVPGQYTHLRTPAADFFPPDQFRALEAALLSYGHEHLGCGNISPMWVSAYVDGCRQELHADVPHGPFAFVLSLTPPQRRFTGGETMLLRPHVLDYWRGFDAGGVSEAAQLLELVTPEFNRLTVFDGRVPHGVRVVEGTHDVREARLVVHGWFLDPAPFFEGALSEEAAAEALNAGLEALYEARYYELRELPPAVGCAAVALHFDAGGALTRLSWLADTLAMRAGGDGDAEARGDILRCMRYHLRALRMPPAAGPSTITLPFVFD